MKFSLPRFGLTGAAATLLLSSMTVFAADTIPVQLDTTPPPLEGVLTADQTPSLSPGAPAGNSTDTTAPSASGNIGVAPTANPDKPAPSE